MSQAGESDRIRTVRDSFRAYETRDRDLIEGILSDELTFYAPPDPGIDRETYFERCWANAGAIEKFEFIRLEEISDDAVLVTYESTKKDGKRFRNTEIHSFDGGKICRVEVYFGWDL
jgi:ketosteroid isomerase-like protein